MITNEVRRTLALARQGGVCPLCNACLKLSDATWEHLQPLSRGGRKGGENRVVAHRSCNRDKGHLTLEEYRAVIAIRRRSDNR